MFDQLFNLETAVGWGAGKQTAQSRHGEILPIGTAVPGKDVWRDLR